RRRRGDLPVEGHHRERRDALLVLRRLEREPTRLLLGEAHLARLWARLHAEAERITVDVGSTQHRRDGAVLLRAQLVRLERWGVVDGLDVHARPARHLVPSVADLEAERIVAVRVGLWRVADRSRRAVLERRRAELRRLEQTEG